MSYTWHRQDRYQGGTEREGTQAYNRRASTEQEAQSDSLTTSPNGMEPGHC
jgi:hypothetical protein